MIKEWKITHQFRATAEMARKIKEVGYLLADHTSPEEDSLNILHLEEVRPLRQV